MTSYAFFKQKFPDRDSSGYFGGFSVDFFDQQMASGLLLRNSVNFRSQNNKSS